ncbi:PTS system mannose/fructose/sorbose family transporter subunit IID [Sharpea azabuensis]|jgi:PTS system N-acetylgalactosamine-specific IID component|uniref:PTS system mannose/fructose/sorbose family transporter subunit IID n=1 Tax=Sharpea porci TaxID=2652286 RepID=A0A844FW95_9FIRM|nr:PTS system mannose/fructose/sorbose family transporter subunit IID [Sharpea porci]MDY5278724.1 PTS system mannose/fructose/sorbose family transporter subunit IID [Sharpea porci]MST89893.1 PTS system mannose/fructose/sorbose family transporter subunit IID [Sharpea porci]
MESNKELKYVDTNPAPRVSKSTLTKMIWRSTMLQASFNYERMQSGGWLWAMLPGLEEIHTNKEDLATSMTHNMDFINTHPFLVTFVMGIVLSMEQLKTDVQTIRTVRISVAAPLGGIGDALFWYTLVPITAGLTANMAIKGSFLGPVLYFVILFVAEMALRYGLMYWAYNLGMKAVSMITEYAQEFTHAASVLGVFVVGALISNYGAGTKLGISIPNGKAPIVIQNYLDMILPCILPLGLTLWMFYLIKKKGWTPVKCIGLILVIGIVGAIFGIWAGSYTPLVPVPWKVVA